MADDLELAGTAWQALIARQRATVEAMRDSNRAVIEAAHVTIQAALAEASRLIEECRGFERRVRTFEAASRALDEASTALIAEAGGLPESVVGGLGHRLVSAVSAVSAVCEILGENRDMTLDRRNAFLDMAIKDTRRLTAAVGRLVDFARTRSGRLDWSLGPVDPAAVIADAVAETRPLFAAKGVALEVAVTADLPRVRADHRRLVQTLVQLLTNAARFCEAGRGHSRVAAEPADGGVRIAVADDGPGVAAERRRLVFAPYLETADTLADEPRGIGIGLALARAIVEHLGGTIAVGEAPGGGALFTIRLPGQD